MKKIILGLLAICAVSANSFAAKTQRHVKVGQWVSGAFEGSGRKPSLQIRANRKIKLWKTFAVASFDIGVRNAGVPAQSFRAKALDLHVNGQRRLHWTHHFGIPTFTEPEGFSLGKGHAYVLRGRGPTTVPSLGFSLSASNYNREVSFRELIGSSKKATLSLVIQIGQRLARFRLPLR
ncbi:MAG: hypothetical protein HY401_08605 [Elusimicrobia bacterium]|nr:hypothetical protein [Elusimicrobiota bacterium]